MPNSYSYVEATTYHSQNNYCQPISYASKMQTMVQQQTDCSIYLLIFYTYDYESDFISITTQSPSSLELERGGALGLEGGVLGLEDPELGNFNDLFLVRLL
jgi:hypothetical protein